MKQVTATVTRGGQVTIPAEVRRILGIRPGDKLVFTISGSTVSIARESYTIESLAGSIRPLPGAPLDIEEQIRLAKEEHAERIVARMKEGLE